MSAIKTQERVQANFVLGRIPGRRSYMYYFRYTHHVGGFHTNSKLFSCHPNLFKNYYCQKKNKLQGKNNKLYQKLVQLSHSLCYEGMVIGKYNLRKYTINLVASETGGALVRRRRQI